MLCPGHLTCLETRLFYCATAKLLDHECPAKDQDLNRLRETERQRGKCLFSNMLKSKHIVYTIPGFNQFQKEKRNSIVGFK